MTQEQAIAEQESEHDHPHHRHGPRGGGNGDMIYVLGAIGAGIYYWKRADDNGEKALGVLKALVWPATLVYEAFGKLKVD